LAEAGDVETAADDLIRLANDAGGEDNITVVIIDFTASGNGSAPTPATAAVATARPASRTPRDPVRIDTSAPPGLEPVRAYKPPREWPKRLLAWVLSIALLLAGAYFAVNFFLDRAWFVGANDDGFVTIYQGIPEEVAGLDLKEELNATTVALDDLPEFLREDVQEGIKVDSEDEARAKVRDLQERVEEPEEPAREREDRQTNRRKKRNNN
jgi:protein phosphatase